MIKSKATKKISRAKRRGKDAILRVYSERNYQTLLSMGWELSSYTPVSYGANRSWAMVFRVKSDVLLPESWSRGSGS